MATYSDRLRLELMTTGEFSGTWGDRTNVNMGTILEQAIAGLKTITMTDADKTLTTATGNAVAQGGTDYTDDEARYAILSIVSSENLTSARNVVIPARQKIYIIKNGTTGGQQLTIKTSAGTGLVIPNGKTMVLYCDGTNTQSAIDNFPAGTTIGGAEIATTTTGQTFQNKTIESSTVDSTTIGASTPSTGAFTTLTSSSTATLDGTTIPSSKTLVDTDSTQTLTNKTIDSSAIGSGTASTGAFTTLTSSSTTTLNGTTIPASKTLTDTDSTQTLTNKTLTSPTITSPVINEITHEGTADDFETTIAFTDPTADRTITFPDAGGTVSLSDTTYTAGTGLELIGTEFSVNLGTATTNTATQASVGTADGRTYLVQADGDGDLVVNVPWENTEGTDTTYSSGTGLTLNGTTFDANVSATTQTVTANSVSATASRTYALQVDASDNLVVNVPWVNTTYDLSPYAPLAGATFTGAISGTSLTLSGDLTVNGTTTTLDSTNTVIQDNLLELNSGVTTNANDSGIIIERGSTGDNAVLLWDESLDKFALGTTTATADSAGNISYSPADLVLNNIVYEGTADDFETTLAFTDPTADRTITFPDAGGTVALTSDLSSYALTSALSSYAPLSGATFTGAVSGTTLALSDNLEIQAQSPVLEIIGTSAGTIGPNIQLHHNSTSPADNDQVGHISFYGEDSSSAKSEYAKMSVIATDVSATTKDSVFKLEVQRANTFKEILNLGGFDSYLYGTQWVFENETDVNPSQIFLKRSDSLAATDGRALGQIKFTGKDSAAAEVNYIVLQGSSYDVTSGTQDGVFYIKGQKDGAYSSFAAFNSTSTTFYNDTVTITSFDAGATNPTFVFDKQYATPADNDDIATFSFKGKNDAGQDHEYAKITVQSEDVTDGSENGQITFGVAAGATMFNRMNIDYDSTTVENTLYANSDFGLDGTSGVKVDSIKDEDTMSSDSATALATQQSIKAYVDSKPAGTKFVGRSRFLFNQNIVQNLDVTGVITTGSPVWVKIEVSSTSFRFNQVANSSSGWKYQSTNGFSSNGTTVLTNNTSATTGIIPQTDLNGFQVTFATIFPGASVGWIYHPNPSSGDSFQVWAPSASGGQYLTLEIWQ